jgi:hypothetical protein
MRRTPLGTRRSSRSMREIILRVMASPCVGRNFKRPSHMPLFASREIVYTHIVVFLQDVLPNLSEGPPGNVVLP